MSKWMSRSVTTNNMIDEWQSAQCPKCLRWLTTPYGGLFVDYPYCPYCGEKMTEEDETNER